MPTARHAPSRTRGPSAGMLGPHFYYDLIRLARKGWPTLARVLYLTVLLAALAFMYRTQGGSVPASQPAEFASRAFSYAYTLIVLQDLLVLILVPVYFGGAIAEEKENRTLESLALTHLTDTELVLGKWGGRLMHVGAIVLSSFPILAFMHLWGNVEIELLIYHEINTFLLLASAGSVCIWKSGRSENTFEAISGAYPLMAIPAMMGMGLTYALPWCCSSFFVGWGGRFGLAALPILPVLVLIHFALIVILLRSTILHIDHLRREERRNPRKTTGALTLADDAGPLPKTGKHGETRSRIHPWAWPISADALWWKECIKDGTSWSLSYRWVLIAAGVIPLIGVLFRLATLGANDHARVNLLALPLAFTYSAYFVALAAYALVVFFQLTMSIAGEREHDTLTFLLMVPTERRSIFWVKWLGPWWRNWPILAIALGGVLLGASSGVLTFGAAPALLLLPWPLLFMLSSLAFLLSVLCRRVLHANIALVGAAGLLFIAHIAAGEQSQVVFGFWIALIGGHRIEDVVRGATWPEATALALGEQAIFLVIAAMCWALAYCIFSRRDYAGN